MPEVPVATNVGPVVEMAVTFVNVESDGVYVVVPETDA
jgi:hypothetical protein